MIEYRQRIDESVTQRMVEIRRDLHRNPELSRQEHRTAEIIAAELRDIGVDEVVEGVAETGVLGRISGPIPGPTVLLRADIDALPIAETDRGQEYLSLRSGVHHGCGHDGHVAILLGTARVLKKLQQQLAGTVLLVFQPAEERGGGARRMLEDSRWPALTEPIASVALHITNDLQTGHIDARSGPVTAAAQSFDVAFRGPGGHAAQPQSVTDPVVAAAEFVMSAQTIVSRSISSRSNVVVGVSCIHGGHTRSAIPTEVLLEGTIRAYDDDDIVVVRRRLAEIAAGIAQAHGCEVDVDIKDDMYPVSVNDPVVTDIVSAAGRSALGADAVTADVVVSGADDMAEFLREFPGCYFRLGAGDAEKGFTVPHHSPDFDFDEDAMPAGAAVLVESVLRLLEELGAQAQAD